MGSATFQEDMEKGARRNGLILSREDAIVQAISPASEESFINIFGGSPKRDRELLVVTSLATYFIQRGTFSVKTRWVVKHEDLVEVTPQRGMVPGGYVVDVVTLEADDQLHEFQVGFSFSSSEAEVEREIAAANAQTAAEEIAEVAVALRNRQLPADAPADVPFSFDPAGPEKAAQEAEAAYGRQEWTKALTLYVKSVDKLHDFYVFEEFRNRQPSPADAWMVQGVSKSLGVIKEIEPSADVMSLVLEACHRLSGICVAVEGAGGNPVLYKRTLDEIGRLTES